MAKIILTENQFNYLTKSLVSEAVGVPEYALDSGEEIFNIVIDQLKSISEKEEIYTFDIDNLEIKVGDVIFDNLIIEVHVNQIDGYDGPVVIPSMGVGNRFNKGFSNH